MSAMPHPVQMFSSVASVLADNGYRPVPIIPGEKRPALAKWQDYNYIPADDARYGSSYTGILCGEVCAVDIDITQPEACHAVRELAVRILGMAPERIGFPPKRLLMYRTDTPMKKVSVVGEAGKVEILGDGQQFVAYAIHPDTGRPYEWVGYSSPLDTPLSNLPAVTPERIQAFLTQCAAILGATEAGVQSSGFADGQEADERWGRAIAQVLAGGDLHDNIRNLAAGWISTGMKPPAVVQALRALMENSAARKLRPRDWQSRYEDIPRAVRSAQDKYEPPADTGIPPASFLLDYAALQACAGNLSWVVKHALPANSVGVLFGASGTFKSFIALDAALHVAHGLHWLGRKTAQGPVVYLAAEGGLGALRRVDAWHKARGLSPASAPFRFVVQPLELMKHAQTMGDAIGEAGLRPALIVVDTMSQTYSGEENSANEVAEYMRAIRLHLAQRFGACVLLVHHSGHSATERPRGSSAIRANTDFLFGCFRDEKQMLATVENSHQKDGETLPETQFDVTSVELGKDADGDAITSLTARQLGSPDEFLRKAQAEFGSGRGSNIKTLAGLLVAGMPEDELREAFYKALGDRSPDTKKKAYQRASAFLVQSRVIDFVAGRVVEGPKWGTL